MLVTGFQGPISTVRDIRVPFPRVAIPKAQGPSYRVPSIRVSGSRLPGSWVPGLRVPGPGSPGPDFRLCPYFKGTITAIRVMKGIDHL